MSPNILFLLTDDQRFNTIHALNNPDIITPNLDRLAAMGTAFTNAHIPGGTSGAVCMPSRAMINTGRTLFHLTDCGQTIDERHTTLGECLKSNGYDCFGTGKWHNSPKAFTRSFNGGGNVFFGGMWDHWNVPVCDYDPTGQYDNVIDFVANFFLTNQTTKVHCDRFNPGVHSSELVSRTACEFIRRAQTPFFCYTAYLAPHDPRTMPDRFRKMYHPDKITLPENIMSEVMYDHGVLDIRDELLCPYPRREADIRRHLAEYYAMITHLDDELGKILDCLDEYGQLDNTIIVMTGDNGLGLGCHGLMGKQSLYDHSIRIPLIVAGPNIPRGETRDNYVYLTDIYPTLCELCGIEIPESVEGISFAPMFADPDCVTRRSLYLAYCELIRGVKKDGWKLLHYRQKNSGVQSDHVNTLPVSDRVRQEYDYTQLFDLSMDPYELNNLAGRPEYADKQNELESELQKLRAEWETDKNNRFTAAFWK